MRTLSRLLAVIPIVLLVGGCASGGPTPPDDGGNGQPDTGLLAGGGALNGYVSAPGSETHVGHLRPATAAVAGATVLVDTGQVGFTNASGAYWIPGVPAGERTLSITVPGSAARVVKVTVGKREITSGTVSAESTLAAGEGSINGHVYESASGAPMQSPGEAVGGRPIEGAALSVETGQTARTDAQGFFHMPNVPPGFRTLTIVSDGGTSTETVLVPAGRTASGTGQLPGDWGACRGYVGTPRTAALPQLVVVADGADVNPVARALVRLSSGEMALTKGDGSYAFTGVAAGNPSLTVSARDGLEATAGVIIASGTITEGLQPPPGFIRRVGIASATGGLQVPLRGALWLRASALDAASQPYPQYRDFTWLSRNTAVATVDPNGVVTGHQAGTAEIVASAGSLTGDVTVTVVAVGDGGPRVVEVIAPSTLIGQGSSVRLTARALDSAGEVIPDAAFTWSSTDDSVAAVTQDGVVGGAGVGSATILCASGPVTGSVPLRVDRQGRRVAVAPAYVSFGDSETEQAIRVWDGAPIPGTPLLWSVTGTPPWLAATPSSGGTPALVDLRVSREDLPAGLYVEPFTLQASGGDATLTVAMAVSQVRVLVDGATIPAGTVTLQVRVVSGSGLTGLNVTWPGGSAVALLTVPSGPATVTVSALDGGGQALATGQSQTDVVRGTVTDVMVGLV